MYQQCIYMRTAFDAYRLIHVYYNTRMQIWHDYFTTKPCVCRRRVWRLSVLMAKASPK